MTTKITEKNISSLANAGVSWQSVVVADGSTGLTAVAGRGYFINTTSGIITVTFPASPTAGDTIVIVDYASTFSTNNVIINFNGNKLEADTANAILSTNDQTHTFVFTDATQGWKIVNQDTGTVTQPLFISATGGTITTDGDFKIHTFTGDGSFVVSSLGNPLIPAAARNTVDYLVVAGGAGGGNGRFNINCCGGGGGGGAGGFREGRVLPAPESYTASPLVAPGGLPISAQTYPITVGGGGTQSPAQPGANGNPSTFSTITSTGGGGGGAGGTASESQVGLAGGSGGGAGGRGAKAGGSGNTPPTSPSQGSNGGSSISGDSGIGAGGGGGAGGIGSSGSSPTIGGNGGDGVGTAINPSPSVGAPGPSPSLRYFAGGGGGLGLITQGTGGVGGGTNSVYSGPGASTSSAANSGGGSGGSKVTGGNGGSGIVIIRYKFQ